MLDRAKRDIADRLSGVINRHIAEARLVPFDEYAERIRSLEDRLAWVENELNRLGPHVATQGERIGVVEQGYRPVPDHDTQAAALEHARARARSDLVSEYEERLNRLESTVGEILERP